MDNRKRILHVNLNNQGGAFSLIYQAQIKLNDKFVFDYFSANDFIDNNVYRELKKMGSKCIGGIICNNRFLKQYKIYKALKDYLKTEPYEFVHIHADTAWKILIFLFAAQHMGIKSIVAHSHSSGVGGHFRGINYMLHIFSRAYIKKANYKCACSKIAARWMFKTEKNVLFIRNSIDIEQYKYNFEKRKLIRNKYGFSDDEIVIGTVGDFSYPKNPKFIYKLIKKLVLEKNYKFLLIGDGPGKKELQKRTSNRIFSGNVNFSGMITNVEDYLCAMDIFILPSRFEGLPICALEAQANGLYTIISDKVSPETKCSEYFISLELKVDKWYEHISKLNLKYDRSRQAEFLNLQQIGIRKTAKQLELLYSLKG